MKISKSFSIDAAHILALPYKSKCNHIHGHTYTIDVVFEGPLNNEGMVLDYNKIEKDIVDELDHKLIMPARFITNRTGTRYSILIENANGKVQLEIPAGFLYVIKEEAATSELLARHIFEKFGDALLPAYSVMISETPKTKAVYYGA